VNRFHLSDFKEARLSRLNLEEADEIKLKETLEPNTLEPIKIISILTQRTSLKSKVLANVS
jgi:hypothetical protein